MSLDDHIWVEKYRPTSFEELVGIDDIDMDPLQHTLLVGPPGTGKTTAARIIIDELGANHIELNASDERGINTVRNKVKKFAMSMSSNEVPRIVFMDEADALTREAQNSLRNLMESYHENCRFILTGNYQNKVHEAIQSRCNIININSLPESEFVNRLQQIASSEDQFLQSNAALHLFDKHAPDIRSAINELQDAATKSDGEKIRLTDLGEDKADVSEIIKAVKRESFEDVQKKVQESQADLETVVEKSYDHFLNVETNHLTDDQKRTFINVAAETVQNLNSTALNQVIVDKYFMYLHGLVNSDE